MIPSEQYSSQIRDHLARPRNRGELADANGEGRDENPVCGDVMTIWIRVTGGRIADARFEVKGCDPSIAAGSEVTEMLKGMNADEVLRLREDDVNERLGGLPRSKRHCAALAVRAVNNAIEDYRRHQDFH